MDKAGADEAKLGREAKFMQGMQAGEAGIPMRQLEYKPKSFFIHRPVDKKGLLSTCYPSAKTRLLTGVEALFHSFHMPYCNYEI